MESMRICEHDNCIVIHKGGKCPYCDRLLGIEDKKDILPEVGQRYACNTGAIYKIVFYFATKNEYLAVNERTETPVVFSDKGENHMYGDPIKLIRKV